MSVGWFTRHVWDNSPEVEVAKAIEARTYCPTCEPKVDPLKAVVVVMWCGDHLPSTRGTADSEVHFDGYALGSADVDGPGNKQWCDVIHRRKG